MKQLNEIVVEHLDKKKHDRTNFDCGIDSLNRYLTQLSGQYEKRDISKTYVAVVPPENRVIGYYSISVSAVEYDKVSLKQFPRHPTGIPLPCALIGKLAVDKEFQGRGLGEHLLLHALKKISVSSQTIAISAVLIHAINEEAKQFYERYGFLKLEEADNEFELVLGIKAVRNIFS